jgi:uncharacterized membrane protein
MKALLLAGALAAALPTASQEPKNPPREPEQQPPDQRQRKYATLVIEVKDEDGKPVENAVVRVDHAGGTTERAGSTGESGFLQLVFIPAGSYFVRVNCKGYASAEQSVKLEADKRNDLVFVLKKAMA